RLIQPYRCKRPTLNVQQSTAPRPELQGRRSPRRPCRFEHRMASGTLALQQQIAIMNRMQNEAQSIVDLPGIKKLRSGKVREVFDLGETLLFVATDRISAFDVILPDPIPKKGAVLNQLSAFWFNRFGSIDNHFVNADFDSFPKQFRPFREQLA